MATLKERQRKGIGHILREDALLGTITEGRIDGMRMMLRELDDGGWIKS